MRFLKTASTRRLLALLAGVVIAITGGAAIAVAAAGNGPVPRPAPLAQAIHGAISAPAVQGVSARISFTDNLIDSSDIQQTDPILQGASGRLWYSASTHQLRIELQSDNGDGQIVVDNRSLWLYDPAVNTAYEATLPAPAPAPAAARHARARTEKLPSVAQIQSDLNRLMRRLAISGAIPGDVAGQAAYTVTVSPKRDGGLLSELQLGWDAVHGVPLRFAIYARGDSSPALELTATDISYGSVPESDFAVSPPSGTKIVRLSTRGGSAGARHFRRGGRKGRAAVASVAGVARRVPFKLIAPSSLTGFTRRSVGLLDWGGSPAALVLYGQGLAGVAVIEQRQHGSDRQAGGQNQELNLPTVSIDGATAQELPTELGTALIFTRGDVTYTVLGSVSPSVAEAAARAL